MEWQDRYDSLIAYWAGYFGRNPRQIKRQIRVESDFNPRAVSEEGAKGLMQFMPETWTEQTSKGMDPFNPEASIMAGCKYMQWLERSLGSLELAIAAYNAGIGRVQRAKANELSNDVAAIIAALPEETREYVKRCMSFEEEVVHA